MVVLKLKALPKTCHTLVLKKNRTPLISTLNNAEAYFEGALRLLKSSCLIAGCLVFWLLAMQLPQIKSLLLPQSFCCSATTPFPYLKAYFFG
jgi:hypothetical protein